MSEDKVENDHKLEIDGFILASIYYALGEAVENTMSAKLQDDSGELFDGDVEMFDDLRALIVKLLWRA